MPQHPSQPGLVDHGPRVRCRLLRTGCFSANALSSKSRVRRKGLLEILLEAICPWCSPSPTFAPSHAGRAGKGCRGTGHPWLGWGAMLVVSRRPRLTTPRRRAARPGALMPLAAEIPIPRLAFPLASEAAGGLSQPESRSQAHFPAFSKGIGQGRNCPRINHRWDVPGPGACCCRSVSQQSADPGLRGDEAEAGPGRSELSVAPFPTGLSFLGASEASPRAGAFAPPRRGSS